MDHPPASVLELGIPHRLAVEILMSRAVDFHNELGSNGCEIDDEDADGVLTTEVDSQFVASEMVP